MSNDKHKVHNPYIQSGFFFNAVILAKFDESITRKDQKVVLANCC